MWRACAATARWDDGYSLTFRYSGGDALSIDRPRRIFRRGLPRLDPRGVAAMLGASLTAAAGVALAMLPHHEAAPPPLLEELRALPAQVAVVDGGTLRLGDRVVRLQGVEAPARGTECGAGGGSGEDCGVAAANALAALVRGTAVACRVTGVDGRGHCYAVCQASGTELNRAVIAAGWARVAADQPALKRVEDTARAERRGVWARHPGW